ncbi:MAG: lytic transglycosylase domain-containing protein [Verrucomicrobiota bacterium]|nr:lytic transglycosylase domain-containing protein [Verrucomicrobiota bacterium]
MPDAPLSTLRAIAKVESGYSPFAISINNPDKAASALGLAEGTVALTRQPASLQEAVSWAKWLLARRLTVSIGLMQVNVEHLPDLGLSLEQAFEPCANLRAGWIILNDKYRRAVAVLGKGQLALHVALSSYNSGSLTFGFENGYVEKVLAAGSRTSPTQLAPPGDQFTEQWSMPAPKESEPAQTEAFGKEEDPFSAPTKVVWIRSNGNQIPVPRIK